MPMALHVKITRLQECSHADDGVGVNQQRSKNCLFGLYILRQQLVGRNRRTWLAYHIHNQFPHPGRST